MGASSAAFSSSARAQFLLFGLQLDVGAFAHVVHRLHHLFQLFFFGSAVGLSMPSTMELSEATTGSILKPVMNLISSMAKTLVGSTMAMVSEAPTRLSGRI